MFIPSNTKVFLAVGSTDMRKSINGLSILVEEKMKLDPFSGYLFVFCNRRKNIVKILYWQRNGFCLWQKRLEEHSFFWPDNESDVVNLDTRRLLWLLDGLDFRNLKGHKSLSYRTLY